MCSTSVAERETKSFSSGPECEEALFRTGFLRQPDVFATKLYVFSIIVSSKVCARMAGKREKKRAMKNPARAVMPAPGREGERISG